MGSHVNCSVYLYYNNLQILFCGTLAGWGVRSRPGKWGSGQAAALLALLRIHIYRLEFYMRFYGGKSSAAKKIEFEALYHLQCATWQVNAKPGVCPCRALS